MTLQRKFPFAVPLYRIYSIRAKSTMTLQMETAELQQELSSALEVRLAGYHVSTSVTFQVVVDVQTIRGRASRLAIL